MKILILTSKYPSEDTVVGFTPVVHYFAKEWVKQGHDVKVIVNVSKFPGILYLIPQRLRQIFESKFGFAFPNKLMSRNIRYTQNNVNIHRIPIFRVLPFMMYSNFSIKKQIDEIIRSNNNDNFTPEIIISHWTFPQLPIMIPLAGLYNCPNALVLHSTHIPKGIPIAEVQSLLNKVDKIGFRSKRRRKDFNNRYHHNKTFDCPSGIDDRYIQKIEDVRKVRSLNSFIYVGTLVKRKNVDKLIEFIKLSSNATLEIVGQGPEEQNLINLVEGYNLNNRIKFHGQIDRQDVIALMRSSDCFLMISTQEVFGLVYLEAMASGCIVVASQDEGMDGIILNGKNGYLCKAGDTQQLLEIIETFNKLPIDEKHFVQTNSLKTATLYSESNVAEQYLKSVI